MQPPLIADAERRLIASAGMPFPINEGAQQNVSRIYSVGQPYEKRIPQSLLTATQRDLNPDTVQSMINTEDELEPIQAVLCNGRYYISDGHHRAVAAKYRGDSTVNGSVVNAAT
jgi:hypothetical protein